MKCIWLLMVLLAASYGSVAQDLSFFHLDKSDGLSDNTVTSVVTDKHGVLWIGTRNGLNSYDGYVVRNFYSKVYEGLQNDVIIRMVCDDRNRIWIQCAHGQLTLLDEKRQFHAISTIENGQTITVDYLLPTTERPMFLNNGRVYGLRGEHPTDFGLIAMRDEPLLRNTFGRINTWDKDKLVFSGNGLLFLFDVKTLTASARTQVPAIVAAERLTDDTAIATCADGKLYKVSLSSQKIIHQYTALKDQYGEPIQRPLGSIKHLQDGEFLITCPSAGLYLFDTKNENLVRQRHDVFDKRTLSSNQTSYIFPTENDFYFIATANAGLNYFKRNSLSANNKPVFEDIVSGKRYNEYVNSIVEDTQGKIWMGGLNTLIEWNSATDKVVLHALNEIPGHAQWGGIRTLYMDKLDRIWVGFSNGLVVFNQKKQVIKHLHQGDGLPDNQINGIVESPDGMVWVCTPKGIGYINPSTFRNRAIDPTSPLKAVQGLYCNTVWFRTASDIWVGTRDGAYNIDLSTGVSRVLTTKDGLAFDETIGFAGDSANRVYIGTRFGFHIVERGKPIRTYKHINTTWPVDCYSLVADRFGDIWFANSDYLASYSPVTGQFKVYDEKVGISNSGFCFYAAHATKTGELLFGANGGITYFRPENIHGPDLPISVMIHEMETSDSIYRFVQEQSPLLLPYDNNTVSFSFSAINLLRNKNVFYQYKLEGIKNDWKKTTFGNRITYSNLRPGNYRFLVKASSDGQDWVDATNPVTFYILAPWWLQRWFLAASLLTACGIGALVVWQRSRIARRQRDQLETEQAINYLATSLHEQKTIEDMLWDMAKNCIGRLKFEDCVIYLKDDERNVLLQKAAWGPKTTEGNKILNPIEIPVGKGIVGSVAESAKAEIVRDTSKDKRYIVDDARRLSEITVPIICNNQLLGIIDSEHSKKGFFTQKHLSILTTIAGLCANKIIRLQAEEEKQRAQLELLKHERQTMEAQLKSLRLQMNPHFLFNSLNSIQQMILAGEDTVATRYLLKFSRLLRLVLLHSDRETVTLKEELETLRLYIELESLRFKEAFHYDIVCNELIDPEEIKIPTLLIQPFAENAIWHGLLHKKGDRYLKISFSEDISEVLVCTIEDNGIGREAAQKTKRDNHTGKGIAVAEERLNTHNEHHSLKSTVRIHDIKDEAGNAMGTKVTLVLPLL